MRLWAIGIHGYLLVACGGTASTVAPIVVPPQPPQPAAVAAPPPRVTSQPIARACNVTLVPGAIRKRQQCFLDERISHGSASLSIPCDGADGPAEVSFEEQRFTGQVKDGKLVLTTHAELDWDGDGCHWENDQRIEGTIGAGSLRWSYTEAATRGEHCSGSCTGSADIKVEQ